MGFQSSFNQALGIFAGAAFSKKHIQGQKESLAEQKMQGKFNVESEINREQERQEQMEVADSNLQNGTAYTDKNEMMADRAGQALASETNSKKETSKAVRPPYNEKWIRRYMEWYGVSEEEAIKAKEDLEQMEFDNKSMVISDRAYLEQKMERKRNERKRNGGKK